MVCSGQPSKAFLARESRRRVAGRCVSFSWGELLWYGVIDLYLWGVYRLVNLSEENILNWGPLKMEKLLLGEKQKERRKMTTDWLGLRKVS